MKVAIVGAGWAGMAAAVQLAQDGHDPCVFEAGRHLGGRARTLELPGALEADNGQHILIGAYAECLHLMRSVGISETEGLLRRPLAMRHADGSGLAFPPLPAPLDALFGIAAARGWTLRERLALLARALRWRVQGFRCAPTATVAELCHGLPQRLLDEFMEPLCVSALNLPTARASGSVFLRVLQDALFAGSGGSNFLVPRVSLGALLPEPAARWLQAHGHAVHTGRRVQQLAPPGRQWAVHAPVQSTAVAEPAHFDAVLLACPPQEAARLALAAAGDERLPAREGLRYRRWAQAAQALEHTAIATVYAHTGQRLPSGLPWLALRPGPGQPAQFVFDRSHLMPAQAHDPARPGLMAFVVSDCRTERATLQQQVLQQAREQLGWQDIQPVRTVVEKRATFACTPGLQRPGMELGHGLWACGDYVDGPYPATLEGAVRSGIQAARQLAGTQTPPGSPGKT
ncbi:hydroxysqualene dehydroxylase HpnE [Comamonas terrae]|uniref:Hydroxysqualene dehydroxylase HpnE n=1 Tax=Comamonas terrae TaxID=673548 RepID=A0ABW5UTC0_9BURK|nr:hydroxysqualene dehydroxylase HpnE [Comamonas terrae]